MIKEAGETGVEMISDLVENCIIVGVIPAEQELRTTVNYYEGEGDAQKEETIWGTEINRSDSEDN